MKEVKAVRLLLVQALARANARASEEQAEEISLAILTCNEILRF